MKRRWILSKDMRVCPNVCQGYSKATAKVKITDERKGIAHIVCGTCGAEEDRRLSRFKDLRPCKRCKDVRDVTVSFWEGTEHWKQVCSTCDLEISAAHHARQARDFAARAKKLRAEQAEAKKLRARTGTEVLIADEISRGAAPALATNQTLRELVAAEKGST